MFLFLISISIARFYSLFPSLSLLTLLTLISDSISLGPEREEFLDNIHFQVAIHFGGRGFKY